ncbi:hypothetical protein [Sinorhizobium fredii]|uniref:hypothetical protein n=1 Tax=Rhizobium fredii TaxID=380 RepID=UPI0035149C6B
MNITLLVQFLALLEEMKTREEILPEFERLLDRCGFDFYGVVRQPKPHENPLGCSDKLTGRGFPSGGKSDSYVDAPYGKGFLSGGLIGCFHMSGLFVRYEV